MTHTLRDEFLLDPEVAFLNHGSFGACPRPVFESYQAWQLRLERQPVRMLGREITDLVRVARQPLAALLNGAADDLVYVPNATAGVNMAARSLCRAGVVGAGDEVLTTDHEYGACDWAWQAELGHVGAHYSRHPIPLPVTTAEAFIEALFEAVTPRTRVIYLSHITSATGLIFPVAEICARARALGLITVIDGAHAPALVPLDLAAIGADFYTGNLHKWLCAPKGAAFLHVRPEWQYLVEPLYVSWGSYPNAPFADRLQIQGTRDSAAYLAVPDAIDFVQRADIQAARQAAIQMADRAREALNALIGMAPIAPPGLGWFTQMAAVALPTCDELTLKTRLYDEYAVEIPIYRWNDTSIMRLSVAVYTVPAEIDRLLRALEVLLPQVLGA